MASIEQTIASLGALQRRVSQGADTIAQSCAEATLEAKVAEIDKTYQRPVTATARGKPAYKRSGALKKDQAIVRTGAGKREVRNVGESAAYEPRLANLPTGRDGINRSNDAAPNAQQEAEKRLPTVIAETLTKVVQG